MQAAFCSLSLSLGERARTPIGSSGACHHKEKVRVFHVWNLWIYRLAG